MRKIKKTSGATLSVPTDRNLNPNHKSLKKADIYIVADK